MNAANLAQICLLGKEIELKDLVGKHYLSGVEFDGNDVIFVLDGVAFIAEEDPQDGYRSCMDKLKIYTNIVKNTFKSVKVDAVLSCDVLLFIDCNNKKEVLRIGTDGNDSYYPFFVNTWMPENLSINWKK